MVKTYRDRRRKAEARLAQLQVNYEDPLAFLDQCAAMAGMLNSLHRRFTFDQRKALLQSVFKRIDVEDRSMVHVELNPPFSFFFDDQLRKLFENLPIARTRLATRSTFSPKVQAERFGSNTKVRTLKRDETEQVARFASSTDYLSTRQRL